MYTISLTSLDLAMYEKKKKTLEFFFLSSLEGLGIDLFHLLFLEMFRF